MPNHNNFERESGSVILFSISVILLDSELLSFSNVITRSFKLLRALEITNSLFIITLLIVSNSL